MGNGKDFRSAQIERKKSGGGERSVEPERRRRQGGYEKCKPGEHQGTGDERRVDSLFTGDEIATAIKRLPAQPEQRGGISRP